MTITMKRAIIVLILGITSISAATVTINLSVDRTNPAPTAIDVIAGQIINLSVISDTSGATGSYFSYLEMNLPAIGTVSNIQTTTAAGSGASVTDYSSPSLLDVELMAYDAAAGISAGEHFTFIVTIDANAEINSTFDLWITEPDNTNYPAIDTVTFNVVPEPVTMVLLGLGGVLIRRRF